MYRVATVQGHVSPGRGVGDNSGTDVPAPNSCVASTGPASMIHYTPPQAAQLCLQPLHTTTLTPSTIARDNTLLYIFCSRGLQLELCKTVACLKVGGGVCDDLVKLQPKARVLAGRLRLSPGEEAEPGLRGPGAGHCRARASEPPRRRPPSSGTLGG